MATADTYMPTLDGGIRIIKRPTTLANLAPHMRGPLIDGRRVYVRKTDRPNIIVQFAGWPHVDVVAYDWLGDAVNPPDWAEQIQRQLRY